MSFILYQLQQIIVLLAVRTLVLFVCRLAPKCILLLHIFYKTNTMAKIENLYLTCTFQAFRIPCNFHRSKGRIFPACNPSLVYVTVGLHAVQLGNNWMRKILRTAKIGRGRRPGPIWQSEEFFESSYFQIGQACTCSPVTY